MLKRISRWTLPLLVLLAALGIYRLAVGAATSSTKAALPNVPWQIKPLINEPLVASDAELTRILTRMVPPTAPVNTNNFVHGLRLWGVDAQFPDSKLSESNELRQYFLDDRVYRQWNGPHVPALFELSAQGLRARSYDDSRLNRGSSSFHTNDLLATLAEVGTPLDTTMQLRTGESHVRQLADTALRDFHLSQHEFEWTVISYARYYFPQKRFKNKFGETITVDDLVDLCVDRPMGIGPCNGLHRLEALIVMYRADEQARVLSHSSRQKLLQHLAQVSVRLIESQTDAGYWTRHWPQGVAGQVDKEATVYDKLLVTGHHLEWLALAPIEVQPPREHIIRAARWTVKTMLEIEDTNIAQHYGPFTHAARAICLWRGREAGEVWAKRQPAP